ncbi:MAG TPA: hypothetical protein VHC86_01095 [Opitutaceae bacterium]|nr:hypothetical protein [Opitutaceae bacterium]
MKTMVTFNFLPDFADAGIPPGSERESGLAQSLGANARGDSPEARSADCRRPVPETWLSRADEQTLIRMAQTLSPAQADSCGRSWRTRTTATPSCSPTFRRRTATAA